MQLDRRWQPGCLLYVLEECANQIAGDTLTYDNEYSPFAVAVEEASTATWREEQKRHCIEANATSVQQSVLFVQWDVTCALV